MKWWVLFLLLSGIFLAPSVHPLAGVLLGLFYLGLAIYAGWRDE